MFHDEELKIIEKEYRDIIDPYHLILDQISEDIRNLEKLLQNAGVGDFGIEISKRRHLAFEEKRIKYVDQDRGTISPLIEQKSSIRVEVSPYLSKLFQACIDIMKKGVKK